MPLIIAATDFSDVSQNAVKYACRLAVAQNAQVLILHSYIIPVMFSDVPIPSTLATDVQNDAERQMSALIKDMAQAFPELKIKGRVLYGDTVGILDDYEKHTKPLLIIVGNSIAGDSTTWLDNTLREEFKKLKYPVLAVPPGMEYKPVQKICFAFDNKHAGNDIAMQQLTNLTAAFNAELHVLNTLSDLHGMDVNSDIDPLAKQQLSIANPHYHFAFDVENIDEAIQNFVEKNKMDWLVMIPRKHSFFEGLFHKSHTKAVTQNSHIPIVALHENV